MTQPYKPLSRGDNEPLNTDKLNAMTNNDQWLFENAPRATFSGNTKKSAGVKMLATRAILPANRSSQGAITVYFGNTFSVGCQPIVVASVISTNHYRRFFSAIRGIGSTVLPDQRGCTVYVSPWEYGVNGYKLMANVYVQIIAVGY